MPGTCRRCTCSTYSPTKRVFLLPNAPWKAKPTSTGKSPGYSTLALAGTIVTVDAAGCYPDVVEEIRRQKADYVIALKGNQGTLHGLAQDCFTQGEKEVFPQPVYAKHSGPPQSIER